MSKECIRNFITVVCQVFPRICAFYLRSLVEMNGCDAGFCAFLSALLGICINHKC